MNWLRLYHGTATDPKWRVVAKKADVPISVVLGTWMTMLENASESTNRGTLEGWNPEYVATTLETETRFIVSVFDAMQGHVLQGNSLTGWKKRQPRYERPNDLSTERVKKHRELKRSETQGNASKRTDKIDIKNTNTVDLKAGFERLWAQYPAKDGRKEAEKHFAASVKSVQDLADCEKALAHYIEHLRRENWKKPKNGSTWFNNWRDWIEPGDGKLPKSDKPVPVC